MTDKLQRFLGKCFDSVTTKIVVIIVLAILPLNILVIASTNRSIYAVQQQTTLALENVANLYMQQLDSRVFSVNYYFYDLEEHDEDFIRLSLQAGDDAYQLSKTNIAGKFTVNIETTTNADGYFYYAKDLNDFLLTMPAGKLSLNAAELRAVQHEVSSWLCGTNLLQQSRWSVVEIGGRKWLVRIYGREGFYYGALLSLDRVCSNVRAAASVQNLSVKIDENPITHTDDTLLYATGKSQKLQLYLHTCVPKKQVLKSLPLIQWVSIILAFAYLLVLPVLFGILNSILLRPLNKIRSALLRLKTGDRKYRISTHQYAEEFRSINQSFNEMADNIESLKIENYEKELERQKMELQNLQLHIRPHFLLNTFNLVYSLAQIQEYQSIQKLALYLSNYFRYIFRSGKELEAFEKEYSLIREYLEISSLRYPDGYDVVYRIQEAALAVLVPPLMIHSFVENIINHALKAGVTVHIILEASYENGLAQFVISDSGLGISENDVAYINTGMLKSDEDKKPHIGISNSYMRLRYFYGEESSIKVIASPGQGTRFTISFPYRKQEV